MEGPPAALPLLGLPLLLPLPGLPLLLPLTAGATAVEGADVNSSVEVGWEVAAGVADEDVMAVDCADVGCASDVACEVAEEAEDDEEELLDENHGLAATPALQPDGLLLTVSGTPDAMPWYTLTVLVTPDGMKISPPSGLAARKLSAAQLGSTEWRTNQSSQSSTKDVAMRATTRTLCGPHKATPGAGYAVRWC